MLKRNTYRLGGSSGPMAKGWCNMVLTVIILQYTINSICTAFNVIVVFF